MRKNLPELNAELLHLENPDTIKRCPTGAITWIDSQQFAAPARVTDDVVS